MNLTDTKNAIEKQKQQFRALGVTRIGIFGSSARGEQNATSDVDIILDFDQTKKTYRNFIRTTYLLEGLLGRTVDALTPQGLSPYIKPYIDRDVTYVKIVD